MKNLNSSTNFNVSTMLVANVARNPSNRALGFGAQVLSSEECLDLALRAADQLHADGINPGDRVAVAISNPVQATVLVLALWFLDATPAVMDARTRAAERSRMTEFLGFAAVLQTRPPPGVGEFPGLCCDDAWWQGLGRRQPPERRIASGNAPAMITLSSGTTGLPMATGFSHDRYQQRILVQRQPGLFWPGQTFLNPLSFSYSASVNHTFNHLLAGNTVEFSSYMANPEQLAASILRTKAEIAFLTRSQLGGLLALDAGLLRGSCLEVVFSGGAYLPEDQILAAMDRIAPVLAYSYSTGVSGQIAINFGESLLRNPKSVGVPLPGVHVEIVDDNGQICAVGEAGHIRVASPAIASFAITPENRKGQDRIDEKWAIPGDIGVFSDDGTLTITGRSGTFIVSGGATIYPEEIETVLAGCPNVRDCAVVAVPSETHGEDVVAIVVASGPLTLAIVQSFARANLSPAKCPKAYYISDDLAYNVNGKLDRAENRVLLENLMSATQANHIG